MKKGGMWRVYKNFRSIDWFLIIICFGLLFFQVYLELKIPEYLSNITTILSSSNSTIASVWQYGKIMLWYALGAFACAIMICFIAAFVGASFARRMRSVIYDKISAFSMAEMDAFSTASLVTRSTNDVTQCRMLITMGLQMLIKAPIAAIWAIIKVSQERLEWSIAVIVAVGILCIMFTIILWLVVPRFNKMQKYIDNLNKITRENLLGISVVRAYNAEIYQANKFNKANDELVKTQIFTSQASGAMLPIMSIVLNTLNLAIFWTGAYLINNSSLDIQQAVFGKMVVFSTYSVLIVSSFMQITMVFIFLPRASVSAKRILQVLDTEISIVDGDCINGIEQDCGKVQFDNVSFSYPNGVTVLKDISFSVKQGQTVAFIGSTGSGKTTLVNLIARFYDATSGVVMVDGLDVKRYKLASLYKKIGFIPQKAVMFDGTIASNVAFGHSAPLDSDIQQSLDIAQAEFVATRQDGLQASIARGGGNLSGGQKQRLSIARAIYKNPQILIFDDSFSALDYKTDKAVRAAIKNNINNTTRIVVAQRIGTIMDADKIIVLDYGQIVGQGTHAELLNNCTVYKEIARSQLSDEELAI